MKTKKQKTHVNTCCKQNINNSNLINNSTFRLVKSYNELPSIRGIGVYL